MGAAHAIRDLALCDSVYTSFRDSVVGCTLRRLSGRRLLLQRVERRDYVVPQKYLDFGTVPGGTSRRSGDWPDGEAARPGEKQDPGSHSTHSPHSPGDDTIYVTWDGPDDPDNPKNWPLAKKLLYTTILSATTLELYMGSAIVSPVTDRLIAHFHTTEPKVELGVTLFVWGYGISSLCFGPMSETPSFRGRNYIYLATHFVYVCLQIPLGCCNHVGAYAALRLVSGLMASPPLCNGTASLADIWPAPQHTFALMTWSLAAVAGPYLGPLVGAAVANRPNTWRWVFWFQLIEGAAVLAVMLLLFPETSEHELLTRKARTLRRLTGNPRIASRAERHARRQSTAALLRYCFWYPIELVIREPVLALISLHIGLDYALVYIYLQAIPISLGGLYGFNGVQQGLAFLSLLVGAVSGCALYASYTYRRLVIPMRRGRTLTAEQTFVPAAIIGSVILPVGLLIFGWTSTPARWEPPVVFNSLVSCGIFMMLQPYLAYISALFPTRIASAIAGNTLVRCLISGAFPLFATVMYKHTAVPRFPVAWGCTILGFSAILLIALPVYLLFFGENIRMRTLKKYGAIPV